MIKGLGQSGFSADSVGTLADALHVLATMKYAAVVLDRGLSDEDGLTLLHDMRRKHDTTPVPLLTARGGVSERVTGQREGGDDGLVKPFALEELVVRLQARLRRPANRLAGFLPSETSRSTPKAARCSSTRLRAPSLRGKRRCWRY